MAARFLRRPWLKAAAAGAVLGGASFVAASDDPWTALKICTIVPVRILRLSFTAATIAFDYEFSLRGVQEGSADHTRLKHEAHLRSARRLRDLCFRNGGIYIKLGQHIAQLDYVVPPEYLLIFRESMLKRCPVSSYDQVCNVFTKELGKLPEDVFMEFDPIPLASASLAQVHSARLPSGEKVAVKVQHTYLTDTALADFTTVNLLVNFLHWCFPAFDYRWLAVEIKESAPKELDFLSEARNNELCLENFRRFSPSISKYVYAPKVYWNLSTSKLLTMEFMEGAEVTDVEAIQRLGLRCIDVAKLVSQVFAEMIFKHGFVHCDPHAANLMVRILPTPRKGLFSKRQPQLILLDHGLYRILDDSTRTNYAALWKSIIFADADGIKASSVKLGAGEDLHILFAGILTMRPWKRVIDPSVDHLLFEGNDVERSELQMYASQLFPQISELLRRLPRVILLMLKTNDCIRAVHNSLLRRPSLETLLVTARVSTMALAEAKTLEKKSLLSRLPIWTEQIMLEIRLLVMQLGFWLLQMRKSLMWSEVSS